MTNEPDMILIVNPAVWGIIPTFLDAFSYEPLIDQINKGYAHGGGWHEAPGALKLKLKRDNLQDSVLTFPGDPDYKCLGAMLHTNSNELLLMFEHEFVARVCPDGTYRIARID